jgi:23S rRNA pseudouridine2604 synthase
MPARPRRDDRLLPPRPVTEAGHLPQRRRPDERAAPARRQPDPRDSRDPRGARDANDAHDPRSPAPRRPAAHGPRPAAPPQGRVNRAFDAPRPPGPAPIDDEHAPGSMRLSKRMSELGIASRREADEWIERGWVRVDGKVVAQLGARVVAGQHVSVDAKARQQQAQLVTVLLHKPIGYVSGQAEDGYEPAIVLVGTATQWKEDRSGTRFLPQHLKNLAPAGRLDIDSVGLLVLTQDGRVAKQLIGEDSLVEKEYLVRVQGPPLSAEGLALLNHGLELDGQALEPAQVEWVNEDQLRFVLVEGKKRQIRRMCEAVGLAVTGLKRVRIGAVMLGDLPAGQWRYLRSDEAFG